MDQQHIAEAAAILLDARANGLLLEALPPHCTPADINEAYAIQDAVQHALGPIGGWKVGAKGPDAEPACAPMPGSLVFAAPCEVQAPLTGDYGVESEIAFRLARDLPPREAPYTREDVLAAIESVHPAIELLNFRLVDALNLPRELVLCDAAGNAGFIFGTGRRDEIELDQTEQPIQLEINEEIVCDTIGGNAAGDVLRLLVWLANHAAARCGGLKAGQFITTGTCSGLEWVAPGSSIKAAFAGLGSVSLSVAER